MSDIVDWIRSAARGSPLAAFDWPGRGPAPRGYVEGMADPAQDSVAVWVAPVQGGITAFGFVLEQDLSDVEFEFVVSKEFAPHMYPLAEIEKMTGVSFPGIVAEADQYDTVLGAEVAMSAGAPRKR